MTNDISETNVEEAVPCIALSKNDSYVMSASGGKVSLFNMMTFKVMTTFMPPPPAATFLAFHPQDNNIIAIGMEDSSIQIYNVRVDEVKSKLKGHQKRITGLTFSNALNVLVSSGADAQVLAPPIIPHEFMTCHPCVLQLKTKSTKDIILCGILAICMFPCHLVECAQLIVYYCFFDVPDAYVRSNPLVT
jgi:WD40 repeat protein